MGQEVWLVEVEGWVGGIGVCGVETGGWAWGLGGSGLTAFGSGLGLLYFVAR